MSDTSDRTHVGSFAEGTRTLPHTDADHAMGHFSEGGEQSHDALAGMVGRFSEGDLAMHADHERIGSFGDVDCPVCKAMAEGAAS